MFHYMVGITAPKREDERKIFWLWIAIIAFIILLGIGFAYFIVSQVIH